MIQIFEFSQRRVDEPVHLIGNLKYGSVTAEELQFYAANNPEMILFESEEELSEVQAFVNPRHWTARHATTYGGGSVQFPVCPRCGATVGDRMQHIRWHLASFGENNSLPSKSKPKGYLKARGEGSV